MFEPIAIVGRSCIVPGAHSPDALWDAVVAGRDLLSSAPPDRWGIGRDLALTPDPAKSADRSWSDRGGYVTGFDFAAEAARDPFRRDLDDLLALDPLFHLVLSAGRAALRDAGHDGRPAKAAAIVGNLSFPSSGMARYAEHVWLGRPAVDPRNRFMSGLPALLLAHDQGLLAQRSFALDAACASSLYAIKLACDALHRGDLDLAVAGAVCRSDDLFIHVGFCALDAMSKTGRSRPFHAEADGLVPAEGAAFVALKRLRDAVAAGDRIHGVIRGIGLSNDGRGRGLLAPASEGQVRALRAAWEGAGVDPARLGFVECHATGTPVGDATEVETLRAFLGDRARDLPLGSLKSNLGHLITAAGAAALIKVLGAFRHGVLPPTIHLDRPSKALAGTPFRVPTAAEPWTSDGPRLAAIDAFGFGGNNAHLIVEEYVPSPPPTATANPTPAPEIAVVAVAVRAGDGGSTAAFVDDLRTGRARGPAKEVVLPLEGLRFPPRDLEQTLAQQLLVLDAAMEAAAAAGPLPRERTAVLVGSQSDPEVCRYGARWRLREWFRDQDPAWVRAAADAVVPVLESPGVVGNMPNIPANRISSQLDLGGPGFTIAQEELSGTAALRLGIDLLRSKDVDVALVGAVDLSAEAVHAAAAEAVGLARPGDAAVVLVLMRLDDAKAQGRPVLATLPARATDGALKLGRGHRDLAAQFGQAHAAAGLLHVAAGVLAVAHGFRPGGEAWTGERAALIGVAAYTDLDGHVGDEQGGASHYVAVRAAAAEPLPLPAPPAPPKRPFVRPAHPPAVALPPRQVDLPLAPALPSALDAAPANGSPAFPSPADLLPRAPALPPVVDLPAAPRVEAPAPVVERPAPAPVRPAPAPVVERPAPAAAAAPTAVVAAPSPARAPAPAHLAGLADLHRRLGEAHRDFIARQQAVHARFLALRQQTTQAFLDAARTRGTAAPAPIPAPAPTPNPNPTPTPVAKPVPVTPPQPKPAPKPAPAPPAPPPVAADEGKGKGKGKGKGAGGELPGPKWSREQLEVLASDKISKVFGPMFALQDEFRRQVRMPEPPLLLADRVIGLDAEPGSMTTGTIWTETDVRWDSWYLHDGTMPAGVMIEAGQADLLLISWLGADFQNRGERVYRLLGCQLTYSGGLPRPDDTLRYEIHVDGHAKTGATRIFFFHYDCADQHGNVRLKVRQGQAGFFSDAELAESGGILWSPETGEHSTTARLDPPAVREIARSYTHEQILAFARGDAYACFSGKGYERLQTHVRTPRIAPPPMSFWQRVTELDPKGGPWKRGYLRAEQDVTPEDWFFQGHFKDDPCMPGTMMFEACLQASAFYLAALGFTIRKDGWTFEPVPDVAYDLKCRGQVIPSSKHLVYEVFVEEVHDGPWPTVYADFLVTVDGLKAFHARRVGLRLRPDWPITSRPELQDLGDPVPVASTPDGFRFGYDSLLACAWGKPSDAFGKMYAPFDEGKHCARLPGPPYHFMSRVTKVEGAIGQMELGTRIELEYDVPPDEWYFRENGFPTMPFCVLLEAALQPCGWIASYVGSALTTDKELFFRNLDGTATWHVEVLPESGTLVTRAKITAISTAGGMIIEGFDVTCLVDEKPIYDMKTVFGFFPRESLANQVGMPPTPEERARRDEPCDFLVDLTARPARYCEGSARLPTPMLLMLDRVTGFWPTGGKKGLGRVRAEKDVDPSEWFFKAHFFADPVQPGSLGLEALVQLLQFYMLHTGLHEGMENPRFEPLMLGRPLTWKYRGQVVPENEVIRTELDIVEVGEDERGRYAVAEGWLWVDELRIYQAINLGMRLVPSPSPSDPEEVELDPENEPWLADHRPTWTVPALPAMSMVDRLTTAAADEGKGKGKGKGVVVEVRDVTVRRWLTLPARTRTRVEGERVVLEVAREGERWDTVCDGVVALAEVYPAAPAPLAPLADAVEAPDPYEAGHLFHGPAFRYLTRLAIGPTGSTAILDAGKGAVPHGTLNQGLLDAVLHAIPHDAMHRWSPQIRDDLAAYPLRIDRLAFFGPAPTAGEVRVEARFDGLGKEGPRVHLQAIAGGRVWLALELVEVLVPKGPIGRAPADLRQAFLRDRKPVGLGLSRVVDDATVADPAAIRASDWLPGTVAAVYGTNDPVRIAVADHVARVAGVHPGTVRDGVSSAQPLTRWPVTVEGAMVRSAGPPVLDLRPVETFWDRWFGIGRWPVEDLYYGLARRFVRRVHVEDPDALARYDRRSLLFLANHQVGVESLLFSILASGLTHTSTVTLAKAEHRTTWLGRLIAHCFAYPGVRDPEVITFFDREDKGSLPAIVGRLAAEMAGPGKSVMVHIEGTRSLECRTPVQKMSGAFLDMAIQVGAAVVPVRFLGGLPPEPLPARLEFPVGYGTQDLWLGRPIPAAELAALPYKERKDRVIGAINALGVPNAEERPFPGDPAFAAKVDARIARTGAEEPHAVLIEVLAEAAEVHPDLARILEGDRAGALRLADDPRGRWLGELARRLYGPRGAKVELG